MFYEDVIAEREGGQPMNNNISAGNSSDNTSNTRVHYLDYEAPTNVEWLWSITVAIFVLFGMIGAFVSGKWADYFGRQVHVCDSISLFNIIYVCSEVDLRQFLGECISLPNLAHLDTAMQENFVVKVSRLVVLCCGHANLCPGNERPYIMVTLQPRNQHPAHVHFFLLE